ncbi:MAG: Z1 domain-containing protein [Planctomycetia bacterium]|nr:Z1 domain-containing protein [Planctomycetia bacterium]
MTGDSAAISFGFKPEHVVDIFLRGALTTSTPTVDEVHRQVEAILLGPFESLRPHIGQIVSEILRRIDVKIGAAEILDYSVDHEPWLEDIDRSQWRLSPRLQGYLRDHDRLPVSVLGELERSTDQALMRLESPNRPGKWDRRGLVVGHVQSGKTTHYTTLAAKAIDSGYRIVIILAGIHNNLRSQTHERIDKYLLGRDSCALQPAGGHSPITGVGQYARQQGMEDVAFSMLTCTTAAENGDFKDLMARQVWFQVNEGARLVMVVKKNASILRKLRDWLRVLLTEQSASGDRRPIRHPTLFIDDEADQASINTKDADEDPSVINGLIRELLTSFERVGLVGYTATPFANIFIDPSETSAASRFGPDLFPRSFIISLKPPSDYIGPDVVFGHPGDESAGILPRERLPMYKEVDDEMQWVPIPHKKDHVPGPLPDTVHEAIRHFVLVCATRAYRGDGNAHNSMLVHATRFVKVQSRIVEQIQQEVATIQTLLSFGAPATVRAYHDALQEIWNKEIAGKHAAFKRRLGESCFPLPSWNDIWSEVPRAAGKIKVMEINGTSDDALTYARAPEGLSVIAVGGDRLSRGLTLEGLSVSYFLRTSIMFDTLMQMGRWFGYRPRYADLCRVYTTNDLYGAFREIALAVEDLRADLDRMARANRTPEEFGMRVRTPSDGLLITAANKIRRGEPVQVRFAEELVQALQMPGAGAAAQANRDALSGLIGRLPSPRRSIREKKSPYFLWDEVPAAHVLEFLTSYDAYRTHSFLNHCEQLRTYIKDRVANGELTKWTVCLVSQKPTADVPVVRFAGFDLPLINRAYDTDRVLPPGHVDFRAVSGREEELADLDPDQFKQALESTHADDRKEEKKLSSIPAREHARAVRPAERGLLLLYPIVPLSQPMEEFVVSAAISFPKSKKVESLSYTVNDIWRAEYGFIGDWDESL